MTTARSLDMTNKKDLALIRRTADDYLSRHPRWNISDEFRAEIMAALQAAHRSAIIAGETGLINEITATVAKLDAMNIACEQHADKMRRLDAGQSTENVRGVVRLEFDSDG